MKKMEGGKGQIERERESDRRSVGQKTEGLKKERELK